ncbi:hypothetical protein GP486_006690 [Trichoglossum hirsutum]|uniref:Mmc1 C-terminal domain-containing protein n=1 Tax=Trichoglossum hirsutum TaxID=265104 RepID=A0A9P8IE21_9PEZI|nr:hypothetical protein GP486_006690 [Trichoglossum hirsutum]
MLRTTTAINTANAAAIASTLVASNTHGPASRLLLLRVLFLVATIYHSSPPVWAPPADFFPSIASGGHACVIIRGYSLQSTTIRASLTEAPRGLGCSEKNGGKLCQPQQAAAGVARRGGWTAGPSEGCRLVKVLLADPLFEEGSWERQLEGLELKDRPGLLIRYGDVSSLQNSLLPTLSVPSPFLKTRNLEILISNLPLDASPHKNRSASGNISLEELVLVPSLDTPSSASGRFSVITYPVHKALIFGKGVQGAVAYGRYTAGQALKDLPPEDLIKVVVDLPVPTNTPEDEDILNTTSISTVNVQLANSAIVKIRQSLENAVVYEQQWFLSRMPPVLKWLASGSVTDEAEKLKPAVRSLVISLLNETEARINREESDRRNAIANSTGLEQIRQALRFALASWAERAHTELRDELEIAFSSKRWRRLAWWKLFWRVDDVGMIAEEVLSRRWLVEAEKEIIWVAGRVEESELVKAQFGGHAVGDSSAPQIELNPESGLPRTFLDAPKPPSLSDLRVPYPSGDDQAPLPPLRPWPLDIPMARSRLLTATIPPLQSCAQTALVQMLSTSALTSTLSVLLYLSSFSLYESGVVAALGLMWSLRRLQKKWETTKRAWQEDVKEEGRKAARGTEKAVWEVLEHLGRPPKVPEGQDERNKAREILLAAREALGKLSG